MWRRRRVWLQTARHAPAHTPRPGSCGRLDGFWELTLHPWDTAAGGLIVEEAGGRVTTAAGSEGWLSQPSIVASNGYIHADMLAVLASTQTSRSLK